VPLQNRVTPFGELVAHPARGLVYGNRGCLHDAAGQIRRHHVGKRWIACLLEFRGRRRTLLQPGRYTELFFLDEATAFAAGHRPCAECRRKPWLSPFKSCQRQSLGVAGNFVPKFVPTSSHRAASRGAGAATKPRSRLQLGLSSETFKTGQVV
jgi:hypothetical protein